MQNSRTKVDLSFQFSNHTMTAMRATLGGFLCPFYFSAIIVLFVWFIERTWAACGSISFKMPVNIERVSLFRVIFLAGHNGQSQVGKIEKDFNVRVRS